MSSPAPLVEDGTRRRALGLLCVAGLGAIAAAVGLPALGFLLSPLTRRPEAPPPTALNLGHVDALPRGVPIRRVVTASRRDAWAREEGVPVGAVWLVRGDDGVRALSATCTHLGCAVDFDAGKQLFRCPCHGSRFGLDGKRVEESGHTNPAPRDMDTLDVSLSAGSVRVTFVRYEPGRGERVPVGG